MRQGARLGMAMFVLSEAVFFFMLIVAFVYFRESSVRTAAENLRLPAAVIYTACLVASSFSMWRAVASGGRKRVWIWITIALGLIFLSGQGIEYLRLLHQNITISRGLFGTTFFTLTGFHGLHVLIGIVLLAMAPGLAGAGASDEWQAAAVETAAMYWYFVDAVWIVIFSIVYLWTFL